jgi:hypothetical protein
VLGGELDNPGRAILGGAAIAGGDLDALMLAPSPSTSTAPLPAGGRTTLSKIGSGGRREDPQIGGRILFYSFIPSRAFRPNPQKKFKNF